MAWTAAVDQLAGDFLLHRRLRILAECTEPIANVAFAAHAIRKLAEERKAKLQTTFANIKTKMEPAREQFNSWLTDLKDLQKYLNQDLTISGIDAAKDLIAKSKKDGVDVQQTLDSVIAELNSVVAAITPDKVAKK